MPEGVFLVRKRQMKASETLDFRGSEPDFMVFKRRDNQQGHLTLDRSHYNMNSVPPN